MSISSRMLCSHSVPSCITQLTDGHSFCSWRAWTSTCIRTPQVHQPLLNPTLDHIIILNPIKWCRLLSKRDPAGLSSQDQVMLTTSSEAHKPWRLENPVPGCTYYIAYMFSSWVWIMWCCISMFCVPCSSTFLVLAWCTDVAVVLLIFCMFANVQVMVLIVEKRFFVS